MPNYLSDLRPEFKPTVLPCGEISCYRFSGNLAGELGAGRIDKAQAVDLYEDMLAIREFEEMIVKLRSGAYAPLPDYNYRGPTHVSIGQEASSTGACMGIGATDYITSTHRGHGDSIAKGCSAIRAMSPEQLRKRVPGCKADAPAELLEAALEDHIFRTIAELFGKESGYCKGRGGGMHIADFTLQHLGANAIVGGGVPIATGAATACRCLDNQRIVCCFAGDGAYANGVVLESLNWAAMGQFTNEMARRPRGLPIIFLILNNHYGMTGRAEQEVAGVTRLARRAAGFADNNMHAEVVNGMDVLAVRDAVSAAAEKCRQGEGPCLLELDTYRYYGHSLTDPRTEYRTRDEEAAWKAVDPLALYRRQLLEAGVLDQGGLEALEQKVVERNGRAAVQAAASEDPAPEDVIKYMYTDTVADKVPEEFQKVEIVRELPEIKRSPEGELSYKDALKEAMVQEMQR
ncbi:MAG: thiamine pyrophosphate-dependent dehydrogenase E1 component subunit alpha, partial [Kiritimatiellia bacterium]|nr:thiamine pyrophosphate-dependent dehydrogenase E1 component subunit alpha [Lentisphaerota bacterium]